MDSLTSINMPVPVLISMTRHGAKLARQLTTTCDLSWHAKSGSFDEDHIMPDHVFDKTVPHIQDSFAAGFPIIGICSAGILIRALAGQLIDKWTEPPVISIADDGSSVIPLLGGHHGGNMLSRMLANATGGNAAISTAGDIQLGVSLDQPPIPFILAHPTEAASVMARLNDGATFRLVSDVPDHLSDIEASWQKWLAPMEKQSAEKADISIILSLRPQSYSPDHLVYHPRLACLGVGASRDCPSDEMAELVSGLLSDHELSPHIIAGIWSVDLKADEPAMLALADRLAVPLRFYPADHLDRETPRVAQPSQVVFDEIGTHSVAEASALAAAGKGGYMLAGKRKTAHATAAIAISPDGDHLGQHSRHRGQVMLVGIGPGQSAWRTPEATRMIRMADELVGYNLYIDLLGHIATDKPRADYALGQEEDRCRYALEEAGKGRNIAIICSGDAGIYAMGALVFELLDRDQSDGGVSDAARRVAVSSAPGVSALQAAAARSGALLGHDFCTISLSDLLTPWEHIEKRIIAAAEGDFVIAFYNPVSRRRRVGLAKARDILLAHRPADTPVVLASNLGRPEEQVHYRTLATLEVDEVDMLTVVMIGSSASRCFKRGTGKSVYTPRGYAKRIDENKPDNQRT
ncbi:MAG: precorrin-3B C(17)-methyltransferase [Candidatus Puniceispirillales bacterium]